MLTEFINRETECVQLVGKTVTCIEGVKGKIISAFPSKKNMDCIEVSVTFEDKIRTLHTEFTIEEWRKRITNERL